MQNVPITVGGHALTIEHYWVEAQRADAPLLVFLHEGLGSATLWRDFPARLCAHAGCRGLVYSRPGYGHSSAPLGANGEMEVWDSQFMTHQAEQVLPALFQALQVDSARHPPWLLGHSDGGSIALLYAAAFPERVAGVAVVAPHIMVEELSVDSIAQTRHAYVHGDLRQRLARYHADVDTAFWRWNRVWLSTGFRHWSMADKLTAITCPVLAVQGVNDRYGTLEQVRGIARRLAQTQLLELVDCAHAVHQDQPERLIESVAAFLAGSVGPKRTGEASPPPG